MSDNKHILHGLGVEYTYTSEGLVSDAASRERDLLAHIAGLEAEKQALITTSVVVNEELSEAKQAIEWLTEQHEDAYKKVGYQAQRAEQAEAALAEREELIAMLERGGVMVVSGTNSFTLAEFRRRLADLRARAEEATP